MSMMLRTLFTVSVMEVNKRLGLLRTRAPAQERGGVITSRHWRMVTQPSWRPASAVVRAEVTSGWRTSSRTDTRQERASPWASEASWRKVPWTGARIRSKITLEPARGIGRRSQARKRPFRAMLARPLNWNWNKLEWKKVQSFSNLFEDGNL